jgi:predicted DNA-binding transcriptional regulator YafY
MLNKAKRHQLIVQLLRGLTEESAMTVTEIFEELQNRGENIEARTVRRDFEELSSEYGLASTEGYPVRYYLSSDYHFKHQVQFSEPELQVLMIALNNLKHTSDLYFEKVASSLETLIMKNLPTSTVKALKEESKKYFFDFSLVGKPQSSAEKDFEAILLALRTNKCFSCKNISPYKKKTNQDRLRTFAPYRFVLTAGVPYLLVQDIEDHEIKRLRLNRVQQVKILDLAVDPKIKVNWDKYTTESLGGFGGEKQVNEEVEIICDEIMAIYFQEKIIHSTQKLTQIEDNRYRLSFKVPLSSEFQRLIGSFLPHIYEIHNEPLKRDIVKRFKNAMKKIEKVA